MISAMKKILSLLSGLSLAACSVVGIRSSAEPAYQVQLQDGPFEIRTYPEVWVAETTVAGDYSDASSIGFRRLAAYIFGQNDRQEKIAMTAPVLQESGGADWRMTFVMPEGYRQATLPSPLDGSVSFKAVPPRKIAVMRYTGSLNEVAIAAHSQKLIDWLGKQGLRPISPTRSAAYDPPWTIPMLRRNEIHVDVD